MKSNEEKTFQARRYKKYMRNFSRKFWSPKPLADLDIKLGVILNVSFKYWYGGVRKITVYWDVMGRVRYSSNACVFLCVYCCSYLNAGLLVRSQYPEGSATGHIDTGFSWFPCVYKRMLRWFPSFQVPTTCFSCSPPELNSLVTFFSIFLYM